MASLSDESLLAGMAAGDASAAAALVRRYQARVYGLARTIVGDSAAAEDVAQEAFLKAWRYAGAYDARRGRVASWLLTIARNTAIDAVRYHREIPVDPGLLFDTIIGQDDPDRLTADVDTTEHLRQAMRELPREQRAPVVLMVFYGLTAKEVAAREGVPLGTVKSRVRRAFGLLRERGGIRDD